MDFDHSPGTIRVGLTGGIGSGKSTVAKLLSGLGATVIDSDAISKSLTVGGGAAMAQIEAEFGTLMVQEDGALNRMRMRELIYAEPNARLRLEAIVHPLVLQETVTQARAGIERGARCLVFDIPLLVESGRWRLQLDRILVVDCQHHRQVQRVLARSALDTKTVHSIIAAQASRLQRLCAADDVIFNDDLTLAELESEVRMWATTFGLSSS